MAATSATILPLAPVKLYVESIVRLRVSFRDDDAVLTNPTTVTLETFSPCGGAGRTYVFGTDAEITRPFTGKYVAAIEPDEVGRWRFRWTTTGDVNAAEGNFLIQDSPFAQGCWPCDYTWW